MAAGDLSKIILSGSTSGRNILVAATGSPGTTIHTAHSTSKDELWLWAANTDSTDRKLTIEFGGTTSPNDLIEMTIPAEIGVMQVIPGLLLTAGLIVRAFAAAGNVVVINGYVNRID